LDHIFDKYYQKDKFSPGNGIGLAIVKRIVDLNGGNIFVKSSEGNGSTFTIVF
jgi:signal transduction histidine kinase